MKVRFKKLSENAVAPNKAHPTDAGFDLTATSRVVDNFGNIVYGTGISVEIPENHVGLIFPRSSVCKKELFLTNSVGVIDSGYRGEIMVKFKGALISWENYDEDGDYEILVGGFHDAQTCSTYEVGERIAQLIITPIPEIEFIETDELSDTDRGTGGYGSTGK